MELKFKISQPQTGGATSFRFIPTEPLEWIAGQSIKIELEGPYGPLEHRFTISAAPYEKEVAITTRLSGSDYKNALATLKPGDKVKAYGLEGDFTWRETKSQHIFVAGGIGVTPYHSIIKQRDHDGQEVPVCLIYGSSDPGIVFKDELDGWAAKHPELTINYITDRHIEVYDILRVAQEVSGLIYLSGPEVMVDALSEALMKEGVPKDRLVHDWFSGKIKE